MKALWHEPGKHDPVEVEILDELLGGRLYRILVNGEAETLVLAHTIEIITEDTPCSAAS